MGTVHALDNANVPGRLPPSGRRVKAALHGERRNGMAFRWIGALAGAVAWCLIGTGVAYAADDDASVPVSELTGKPATTTVDEDMAPARPSGGVQVQTRALQAPVRLSAAERREARGIRSEADLQHASPNVRAAFVLPVEERVVVVSGPMEEPRAGLGVSRGSGDGFVGLSGCHWARVTNTNQNWFGTTLQRAERTIHNWCLSNGVISSSPTVSTYTNAYWGWVTCGWNNEYSGWLWDEVRYGTGGYARYAYANTCAMPQRQHRAEIQVQSNGFYYWWT